MYRSQRNPFSWARLRNAIITLVAFVPAVGWAWGQAKTTFVLKADFDQLKTIDSLKHTMEIERLIQLQNSIDAITVRVSQIQCGKSLANGCR